VGGIGPCGLQLCCSSFLSKYGNVSIKLAKLQDLSLSSNRLNGVCGQLKCCLSYEEQAYQELREYLPEVGTFIETHVGDKGRVDKIHLIAKQFDLLTIHGVRRRYSYGQFKGLVKEGEKFPEFIDCAGDETQTIIGLEADTLKKRSVIEKDLEFLEQSSKKFAEDVFNTFVE
jgi:hypothetical protein